MFLKCDLNEFVYICLYADDLALVAESNEDLLQKCQIWKSGLEAKGPKVNINKTKILHCMGVLRGLATLESKPAD